MMARCIVETGTSSYYSALKDATDEPVLKQICGHIAADEFRHYKLFYEHLHRCLERDRLSRWGRLRIGWGRLAESEDDELAYAYFAANEPDGAVYDRKRSMQAYARRAYPLYTPLPRAARHGHGAEGDRAQLDRPPQRLDDPRRPVVPAPPRDQARGARGLAERGLRPARCSMQAALDARGPRHRYLTRSLNSSTTAS